VNQSQNRLLRDVKLCSSHFPPIKNKSQYQSCGKMLAASFSTLKLVNQCVIYMQAVAAHLYSRQDPNSLMFGLLARRDHKIEKLASNDIVRGIHYTLDPTFNLILETSRNWTMLCWTMVSRRPCVKRS
jgi:hypothetical protein